MAIALGLRAYTGWAVAIVITEDVGTPRVVARRRVDLLPSGLPPQAYHVASSIPPDAGGGLIDEVVASAIAAAKGAIEGLAREASVMGAGLIVKRGPPAEPPRHTRMSHTGWHAAEGELYRYALMRGIEEAGLSATFVPEAEMTDMADAILGLGERDLRARLTDLGAALGPPWTEREKSAALAAWLALAGSVQRGG